MSAAFLMIVSLSLLLFPALGKAAEEKPGEKVCLEKANLQALEFNFSLRSGKGGCKPGERELEFKNGPNGSLLFLPPNKTESAPSSLPAPGPPDLSRPSPP
ncbi:MAG: hypothetical protein U1F57_04285 [bacterium]